MVGHLVAVPAATADETTHERHHAGLFVVEVIIVIVEHQSGMH
jgi:hypothetical protein